MTICHDIGNIVGQYRLLFECGRGASGKVFAAENLLTGQRCALKIVNGGQRELRSLIVYRDCFHSNLLTVHHVEPLPHGFYYTMDIADNHSREPDFYMAATLALRLYCKSKRQELPKITDYTNRVTQK